MQAQNLEELKRLILSVLPDIIKQDPAIKTYLKDLLKDSFAEKDKTEDRIEKLYEELVRLREESEKRWQQYLEERERMWAELERRREEDKKEKEELWAEVKRLREEERQEREKIWAEMERRREEDRKEKKDIWARLERQSEEFERRWEEYRQTVKHILEVLDEHTRILLEHQKEIEKLHRKHDSTIGALGARWGLHSEESFRNALKGILEESFPVKVEIYLNYDKEGIVFGRPDQIELDLIIKNGEVIVAEIKSSMSKPDVYAFLKKIDFYQSKEGVKVSRAIIISPMVDPKAKEVALKNGIEVYSYADDVEGLSSSEDFT